MAVSSNAKGLYGFHQKNYRPASVPVLGLETLVRERWKSDLSLDQKRTAMLANTTRDQTLEAIEGARTAFQRGDLGASLLSLNTAHKG